MFQALSSGFPTETLHVLLLSPIRTTSPAHFIILDLIISAWVHCTHHAVSFSLLLLPLSYVFVVFRCPFTNTFRFYSSLNATDQVYSHTKEADLVLFLRDRFKIISPHKYKTLSIVVFVPILTVCRMTERFYRRDAGDEFYCLSLVRMLVALFL